jgi:hypothetical protein
LVEEGVESFDIWICPDSFPYSTNTIAYRTWFYFSVTGVGKECKCLKFNIRNMGN